VGDSDRVRISDLPTLETRPRPNLAKGTSRVEQKAAKDKTDDKAAEKFRDAVWRRDQGKCRCCGRVVVKSLELRPDRGEIHHLTRRAKAKALLTDPRNGILICLFPCHQAVTHHEISIVGPASAMFEFDGQRHLDAASLRVRFIKKERA